MIKIERLEGRVKKFDSILKKTHKKEMDNPFREMSDIVGLRVICLFQKDVEIIKEIIRKVFNVKKEEDKSTSIPTDVFKYVSTHFDVTLPDDFHNDEYKENIFEIQLRTICQHAWCAISHNLFYKDNKTVPREIERDFHAINGLFCVADKHFEMISDNLSNRTS